MSPEPDAPDAWSTSHLALFATRGRGRPLGVIVLTLALLVQYSVSGTEFNRLQTITFDLYQRVFPRVDKKIAVRIVDIDQRALSEYGQWPWPRTLLARLIEKTQELGSLAIGLDMVLAEPDRLSPGEFAANYPGLRPGLTTELTGLRSNDSVLADVLRRNRVVVGRIALDYTTPAPKNALITPYFEEGESASGFLEPFSDHLTNVTEVAGAAAGFGYLNSISDTDGVVRRMPVVMTVGKKIVPSMALELLRVAIGANGFTISADDKGISSISLNRWTRDTDRHGRIAMHFSRENSDRPISAAEILAGRADVQAVAGLVVLIGLTGIGLTDVVTTPVSSRIDGVEVLAQFIENLNFSLYLKRPEMAKAGETLVMLLSGLLLILVMPRAGPVLSTALLLGLLAAQFGVGFWAFSQAQLLLDPAFPALGSIAVFMTLVLTHTTIADRNRRTLDAQLEQQRLVNARMAGELAAAHEIQMGILPDAGSVEGLPANLDVYAFLEPAKEVGGDLYDLFMLDEHRLYFMIGDVSGKGVPAALFMALSKALCKSVALREKASVAALMSIANREISREKPGFMFVTAVAGIIDARTGELEFSNAGHDSPYVVSSGKPTRPLESEGGPPICVIDDFPYPVEYARLEPGEILVLTTDGINEAMTTDKKMYGTERMIQLLDTIPADTGAEAVSHALYRDAKAFVAGNEANDDITILTLKFSAPGSYVEP